MTITAALSERDSDLDQWLAGNGRDSDLYQWLAGNGVALIWRGL